MLSARVRKLQQDATSCTQNPLLDAIDSDFMRILERAQFPDAQVFVREFSKIVRHLQIDSVQQQIDLLSGYGEARAYDYIRQKNVPVYRVPRQGKQNKRTPDFRLDWNGTG